MSLVEATAGATPEIEVFPSADGGILVRGCHSDDVLEVRPESPKQMIHRHGVAVRSASPVKYRYGTPVALSSAEKGSTPVVLKEISEEWPIECAVASWHGSTLSPSYLPLNQPDMKISSDTAAAQYPNWVFGLFKWALVMACASILLLAVNFVFWGNPYLLALSAGMFGIAAAFATAAFVKADREDRERSAS